MIKLTFSLLFLNLLLAFTSTSGDWELKKEEEGIRIYTGDKDAGIKKIKIETSVNYSAANVLEVLKDKEKYTNWVYKCSEAKLLKKVNENEYYHYQMTSAPWPIQDRDMIVHLKIAENKSTGEYTLTGMGVPDYLPERSGRVRIKHYQTLWKITPITQNSCQVIYEMRVDPSGAIPAWLYNLGSTEGPLITAQNLRKEVEKRFH